MRKLILLCLLSAIMVPVASEAAPISVNCPNTLATNDREFTLTTDPSAALCHDYGNNPNELNANQFDLMILDGWTLIDKDNTPTPDADNGFFVDGFGAISGSFTLDASLWSSFDRILIGLVVGGGQIDPKWAVFELPQGETSGLWSDAPREGGGLSHVNLYGIGDGDTTVTEVPEPATLLLLGSGLTFAVRRRRAKR